MFVSMDPKNDGNIPYELFQEVTYSMFHLTRNCISDYWRLWFPVHRSCTGCQMKGNIRAIENKSGCLFKCVFIFAWTVWYLLRSVTVPKDFSIRFGTSLFWILRLLLSVCVCVCVCVCVFGLGVGACVRACLFTNDSQQYLDVHDSDSIASISTLQYYYVWYIGVSTYRYEWISTWDFQRSWEHYEVHQGTRGERTRWFRRIGNRWS